MLEESMARWLMEAVSEGERVGTERRLQGRSERQVERERARTRERERETAREMDRARATKNGKEGIWARTKETEVNGCARMQTPRARETEMLSHGAREYRAEAESPTEKCKNEHQVAPESSRSDVHRRGGSNSPRKSWSSGVSWSTRAGGDGYRGREGEGNGGDRGLVWTPGRHTEGIRHTGRSFWCLSVHVRVCMRVLNS